MAPDDRESNIMREYAEMCCPYTEPQVVDSGRFEECFGGAPRCSPRRFARLSPGSRPNTTAALEQSLLGCLARRTISQPLRHLALGRSDQAPTSEVRL